MVAIVLPFNARALAVAFTLAKAAVLPSAALSLTVAPAPDAFKVKVRAVLSLLRVLLAVMTAAAPLAVKVVLAPKVTGPV